MFLVLLCRRFDTIPDIIFKGSVHGLEYFPDNKTENINIYREQQNNLIIQESFK